MGSFRLKNSVELNLEAQNCSLLIFMHEFELTIFICLAYSTLLFIKRQEHLLKSNTIVLSTETKFTNPSLVYVIEGGFISY